MRLNLTFLGLLATATAYLDVGHLIARQTSTPDAISDDTGDCLSAIMDVAGSAPHPPPEIIDVMTGFYKTATGAYDAQCGWQTALPADLVDDWYSYQGEVISWYSASSAELHSALSQCPPGYESSVGPCSSSISGLPAPQNDPATAASENYAPRETSHVIVAGAAAAGFLGVVAAL
ncbi:hypothetical protein MMYC01_205840 [Madurella mycetomatis]|uniref:DUF7735 domain-containing protein n=1 Tax=Madurella mycetomatis TaxID=100816 RepID=A0A175W052_9PEZI|nr:hypothetical protein MMYC01_205840 [Madurella mycetomatis]